MEKEQTHINSAGQFTYIANFSKGLHHNSIGEVDPISYRLLLKAIATGNPNDFEAIILGSTRKLVNPQAGLAYVLEGQIHAHK